MRYAHITGWGKYVPQRVLTNDELAQMVETSDGWIRERTGIAERRIAGPNDTTASMGIAAAMAALDVAGVSGSQLDLIIVATTTPEHSFPATACFIQDALGATHAGAFDLSAACSGFVYGLSMAADAIKAGSANTVLVVGSETLSRIVNWKDRNTCVLFGDGAGAVVLQSSDQPGGVLSTLLRADGSGGELLIIPAGGSRQPLTPEALACNLHTIQMNGREVFRFATRVMERATREVIYKAGWTTDQVDVFVPHQANIRIIELAAKSLGVPLDKFYCNIARYGNTSAASIPIALTEAAESGVLRPKDRVVTVGFGAGLTWAAAAMEWSEPRPARRSQKTLHRIGYGVANMRSRALRLFRRIEDRIFGALDSTLHPTPRELPSRNGSEPVQPAHEREAAPIPASTSGSSAPNGSPPGEASPAEKPPVN
ncbi:MAG: beta-ketoacyl-ACP synthase III [Anaerolineae bacterium]|nr:beta-ketoacyl-ACP synthase III [Anaerolineae bacterium]